jgi:hypothetical protein
MAINRLSAHVEDSLIADVAEFASCNGISFDTALTQIIRKGFTPTVTDSLAQSVGELLDVVANIHGNSALDAAAGAVWRNLAPDAFVVEMIEPAGVPA